MMCKSIMTYSTNSEFSVMLETIYTFTSIEITNKHHEMYHFSLYSTQPKLNKCIRKDLVINPYLIFPGFPIHFNLWLKYILINHIEPNTVLGVPAMVVTGDSKRIWQIPVCSFWALLITGSLMEVAMISTDIRFNCKFSWLLHGMREGAILFSASGSKPCWAVLVSNKIAHHFCSLLFSQYLFSLAYC